MYLIADVSRWLDERKLEPAEFSSAAVGQFLADWRAEAASLPDHLDGISSSVAAIELFHSPAAAATARYGNCPEARFRVTPGGAVRTHSSWSEPYSAPVPLSIRNRRKPLCPSKNALHGDN